jgi:hypothetical protein
MNRTTLRSTSDARRRIAGPEPTPGGGRPDVAARSNIDRTVRPYRNSDLRATAPGGPKPAISGR